MEVEQETTFTFKCVGNNYTHFQSRSRIEVTFMCVSPTRAITRDERLQEVLLHNPTYIIVTCLYSYRP